MNEKKYARNEYLIFMIILFFVIFYSAQIHLVAVVGCCAGAGRHTKDTGVGSSGTFDSAQLSFEQNSYGADYAYQGNNGDIVVGWDGLGGGGDFFSLPRLTCVPIGHVVPCIDQYVCDGTQTCQSNGQWSGCVAQEYTVPACIGTSTACSSISSQSSCLQQQSCSWVSQDYCSGSTTCGLYYEATGNCPGPCTLTYHPEFCKKDFCNTAYYSCDGSQKTSTGVNYNVASCSGLSQSLCSATAPYWLGLNGCTWNPSYCTGTSASCNSFSTNCQNSLGYVQQGCSTGTAVQCGLNRTVPSGLTIVTINPFTVSPGESATVTVNISDARYHADHIIEFNLTIDGVAWPNQYCSIAYINLTQPGTCAGMMKNGIKCMDWMPGTVSHDGNFSISANCIIPPYVSGGEQKLTVVPTTYSSATQLDTATATFSIQTNKTSTQIPLEWLWSSFLKLRTLARSLFNPS